MRVFKIFYIALALLFITSCTNEFLMTQAIVDTQTEYIYVEVEPDSEIWVDSFVQPATQNGVDILWVIDTSGSMYQYEDELLAGMEAMLAALPITGWRLNMISNSPNVAWIDSQFPILPGDDIDDLKVMYDNMSTGPLEAGFDAAYEYVTSNSYAPTWMRHDAAFLVVMVSDEEEQSKDTMIYVQDFVDWMRYFRTSVYMASVINLDATRSVCPSPPNVHYVGDRYEEATLELGGIVVDICSEDWSPGVTDASVQIEPYSEWKLSHIPYVSTIVVFINGVPNHDWIYKPQDNTVYFEPIPDAGVWVEIAYDVESYSIGSQTGPIGPAVWDTGNTPAHP